MNKILAKFGLRIMGSNKIIFLYKIPDYDTQHGTKWNIAGKATYVIEVTKDISKAFDFLHLKRDIIERLEKPSHLTYYLIGNCPYLTDSIITSLAKEIDTTTLYKADPEVKEGLEEFVSHTKSSLLKPNEFDFYPFIIYPGLKEKVVRSFFKNKEFDEALLNMKVKHQEDLRLSEKFNSRLMVIWLPELMDNYELAGMVSKAFVNHVTERNPKKFPSYLADTPKTIIHRELETFYEYIYTKTPEYINHVVDGKDNENVLQ